MKRLVLIAILLATPALAQSTGKVQHRDCTTDSDCYAAVLEQFTTCEKSWERNGLPAVKEQLGRWWAQMPNAVREHRVQFMVGCLGLAD